MGIVLLALVLVGASIDTYSHYHEKKNAIKTELTVSSAESQNLDETIPVTEPKTLDSVNETQSDKP
mgnify:FL=1